MKHRERYILDVMSGRQRGFAAGALRAGMTAAAAVYGPVMTFRNTLFDRGLRKTHPTSVATISIGNLTAGGTGKTPVVLWLARQFVAQRVRPAIITRGYKGANGLSDEAELFRSELGDAASVIVNADRVAGAREATRNGSGVGVILLDDGFQHRRLARDVDVVLVNATDPFGFGHVHPRGLLREPLQGFRRAHAILLTHADEVPRQRLAEVEHTVRRFNTSAPIFHASHEMRGLRIGAAGQVQPIDLLASKRFFATAGIGSPGSLNKRLSEFGAQYLGSEWYADHHPYSEDDAAHLYAEARSAGAELLVTTEKDWVKLAKVGGRFPDLPVARLTLTIKFSDDHEALLLKFVEQAMWSRARG